MKIRTHSCDYIKRDKNLTFSKANCIKGDEAKQVFFLFQSWAHTHLWLVISSWRWSFFPSRLLICKKRSKRESKLDGSNYEILYWALDNIAFAVFIFETLVYQLTILCLHPTHFISRENVIIMMLESLKHFSSAIELRWVDKSFFFRERKNRWIFTESFSVSELDERRKRAELARIFALRMHQNLSACCWCVCWLALVS